MPALMGWVFFCGREDGGVYGRGGGGGVCGSADGVEDMSLVHEFRYFIEVRD